LTGHAASASPIPHLAPGWLLDRHVEHRLFNFRRRSVLQYRLALTDLLQCQFAAFIVQILEPVKAVSAKAIILQAWLTLRAVWPAPANRPLLL
jgi:hypothetical protein